MAITAAGLVFAVGCASTETGTVTHLEDGTTDYGLQEQPQANITGTGTLMNPAHDPARVQPGQFTGKEGTSDRIGQYPVMPRESSGQEFRRDASEPGEQSPSIAAGEGAGTLGQSGIAPGEPVSSSTILRTSGTPSIDPKATAQESRDNESTVIGIGASPTVQSGSETNNPGVGKGKK